MSSVINKVKDAMHSNKSSEPEGTHGHHNTRAANAADPRIDSDRDNRANPHSTTGHAGNTTSTTAGPHQSDMMNKMDPRVDSDRDGSRNMGMNKPHGTSTTTAGAYRENLSSTGAPEGTYGQHNSRLANAADPRIDSDRDGSRNMGMNKPHGTSATGAYGENFSSTGSAPEGTYGQHNSRLANAADPRIDSDRDNSRNLGANPHGTSTTRNTTTTAGPHGSDMMNKVDPRVDSDRDGSRNMGMNTHGNTTTTSTTGTAGYGGHSGLSNLGSHTGPAPNTAGPHKSDMMNKMDPRVDSDVDGSKTMGRDKTFSS